ncbi:MAG: chemotaxis protein CheW [Meiothermus sp.]
MNTPLQLWALRLGEQVFALEPRALKEVLEVTRLTPVPLAPPFVLGLLANGGSILPLVDLGGWLGQDTGQPTLAAVVTYQGQTLALAIHEVLRLFTPVEELNPKSAHPLSQQPFVQGWIPWQNTDIPVLSLDGLLHLLTQQTTPTLN